MAIDSNAITLAAPKQRYEIADYLKVGGKYYLMGTGFTSINESSGAQEDSKTYVNDKETTTWLKGFQREFSYDNDLIISEVPVVALREVSLRGLTGTKAMFEYVRSDLFMPKAAAEDNTNFYARHFIVSAIPDSEEGEGADTITSSGKLKPIGSMTEGWFDMATMTFTEDSNAYETAKSVINSILSANSASEDKTADEAANN